MKISNLNLMVRYQGVIYKITEVIEFGGDYYVETAMPLGIHSDSLSAELRNEISWYKQNTIQSQLLTMEGV